jgi:UDP-N-acetyl-D-galactosamine dehydrogenase
MSQIVGVVGLGYVGLPVAVAFSRFFNVIGFDISERRINALKEHIDVTGQVSSSELHSSNIYFTTDETKLADCTFIIVAVPTSVDKSNRPDLGPLLTASEIVGRNMRNGTVVVYESTVFPGATEEVCIPVLEATSGKISGRDFYVGYSPERINPGDNEHRFENITKIVSGQDEYTLSVVADMYGTVVRAGVHRAPSIKVAEAAKVIENTQRDINIALMNEFAIIFHKLGIDTGEVLDAASTKWNFMKFTPGLVGGHCIGVDPYYLTYKAQMLGYEPHVILAGRRINESMGAYVATSLVKRLIANGVTVQGARVTILGLTFKENVPDLRNSKVFDIIKELIEFGVEVQVSDPFADPLEAKQMYGVDVVGLHDLKPAHGVILAVPHTTYLSLSWTDIQSLLIDGNGVVSDVKRVLNPHNCPRGIDLWRL